jgi:hypothetical protein
VHLCKLHNSFFVRFLWPSQVIVTGLSAQSTWWSPYIPVLCQHKGFVCLIYCQKQKFLAVEINDWNASLGMVLATLKTVGMLYDMVDSIFICGLCNKVVSSSYCLVCLRKASYLLRSSLFISYHRSSKCLWLVPGLFNSAFSISYILQHQMMGQFVNGFGRK